MVTYIIDVLMTSSDEDAYQSPHDKEVLTRMLSYNSTNPLGVSTYVQCFVCIYLPVLVVVAGTLNVLALFVLESNFLQYLVIQPMLRTLLYLHIMFLFVGPFYIWLVQCVGIYISRNQVYSCFVLLWGHNFCALASSSLLVAMIIERALSIGRPEMLWVVWKKSCRNTVNLLLIANLMMSVIGFMYTNGTMGNHKLTYPICLPWWDNEHGAVSPLWYKILAFCFSIGPSILILLSIVLLMSSLVRFKHLMRSGIAALNRYGALFLEIRSTLYMKFVKSVWWLGMLYISASCPLGIFIIYGPANYMSTHDLSSASRHIHTTTSPQIATTVKNNSAITKDANDPGYPKMSPFEYSYLLVSRSNIETVFWISYYNFILVTVPVLLTTEILFRREWKGQYRKVINYLRCRRHRYSSWGARDAVHEYNSRDLVGPYIAKNEEKPNSETGLLVKKKSQSILIYDAGRAQRAGRSLEINKYTHNKYMLHLQGDTPVCDVKRNLSAKSVLTEGTDTIVTKQIVAGTVKINHTLLPEANKMDIKTKQTVTSTREPSQVVQDVV